MIFFLSCLIIISKCYNPFSSVYNYFIHDEIQNIDESQKVEEINFYREIEKESVTNTLISGGITSIVGIPLILGVATGGIGILPLSIPLIIGSYSASNGIVSIMSREKKNEMRFRAGEDYKIWRAHLGNIIDNNKKLNKHSKWVFYLTFSVASSFFSFIILYGKRRFIYLFMCFLIFCFIESYLLTMYIEYKKTIQKRENLIEKWGVECNFNLLTKKEKFINFFNYITPIQYERETGYLLNNEKCNRYKIEINEISVTALDIFTLMGIKNIIRNIKFFYNELDLLEKVFGLVLCIVIITSMIFISRIIPQKEIQYETEKISTQPKQSFWSKFGCLKSHS